MSEQELHNIMISVMVSQLLAEIAQTKDDPNEFNKDFISSCSHQIDKLVEAGVVPAGLQRKIGMNIASITALSAGADI